MSITHAIQAVAESASELRAAINGAQTHPAETIAVDAPATCGRGHDLLAHPEYVYYRPNGAFHCRECNREDDRRYRERHA
jgi:hypothetical protein